MFWSRALFSLLVIHNAAQTSQRTKGLYKQSDNVVILNDTNYHSIISGKEHAWMVEYYASWCGYCRNFAPIFKEFAGEVSLWEDVIKVAVIDCGDDINADKICKNVDLRGYPTIKYFPPFTITEQGENGFNRESYDHTGEALLVDTINFVEEMMSEMIEQEASLLNLWPTLKPLNGQHNESQLNFQDIWPDDTGETFVVIESEASYIGRQIILDLWRRNKTNLLIRRLTVPQWKLESSLDFLNLSSLPALVLLNSSDQSVTNLGSFPGNNAKNDIETRIIQFDPKYSLPSTTTSTIIAPVNDLASESEKIRRRYTLYLSDLDKTVLMSFSQEIVNRETLSSNEELALFEYCGLLRDWYPTSSPIYEFIVRTHELLNHNHQKNTKTKGEDLKSILDDYNHSSYKWEGCRGSSAKYGGYTCGVWSLWHFLTVKHLQSTTPGQPTKVIRAMIDYVRYFFGCRECAEHFIDLVKNGTDLDSDITTHHDAVLFLWERHNDVTLRLMESDSDVSDDPRFPREFYPSKSFCPKCFEEDQINRDMILQFLIEQYGERSLIINNNIMNYSEKLLASDLSLYLISTVVLFL